MGKKNRIVVCGRVAYVHCWKPAKSYGGDKYSLTLIISKDDEATINNIKEAMESAKSQAAEKWGGTVPANLRSPLRDGDAEKANLSMFRNSLFLNAKSTEPPQIVDRNVQPIQNSTDFYSGCYANVSLVFYGYNCSGNRGIGVWLGNIQKVSDGPALGGKITAKDEFTPIPGEAVFR